MTLGQIPITVQSESKASKRDKRQRRPRKQRERKQKIRDEMEQLKTAVKNLEKLGIT